MIVVILACPKDLKNLLEKVVRGEGPMFRRNLLEKVVWAQESEME